MGSDCNVESFKIESRSLKAGELIVFSDTTNTSFDWKWTFGDGTKTSYLSKVTHSFDKPGKYNVKLVINDNCPVERTVTILPSVEEIDVSLFPRFTTPKNVVEGKQVNFQDLTKNAKSWEWRFGDTQSYSVDATDKNPSYTYKTPGVKNVSLVVNGDNKHAKIVKIYVAKAVAKTEVRRDIVVGTFKKRGPEKEGLDDEQLKRAIIGISQNELKYKNFSKYFCKDAMPPVHVNNEETMALKEFYDLIANKKIRLKGVSITKDKDECITFMSVNYK
ncbi:PKD domain-containing protein [Flavobacterium sp.]|nr:PKD domain-containing protein [Flavobacterium sp.]